MFQVSVELNTGVGEGYVKKYGPFETIKEARDYLLGKGYTRYQEGYTKYQNDSCEENCERLSHFFFLKGRFYARIEAYATVLPIEQIP